MIIVTGTGRSGTSTVARLLHTELGVPMGTDHSLETEPSAACPRGSYEDREFREAHIQVQRGGITLPAFRRRVEELVEAREAEFGSQWGLKDPRASHVLGLYLQWFEDVRVVWCSRPPWQIVDSWMRVTTCSSEEQAAIEIADRYRQVSRLASRMTRGPRWIDGDVLRMDFSRRHEEETIVRELDCWIHRTFAGPSGDLKPITGGGDLSLSTEPSENVDCGGG